MAMYAERLPLAVDDLSDGEEVELGEAPAIASTPSPGRHPWAGYTGGAAVRAEWPAGVAASPGDSSGEEKPSPVVDDWADPATFGTTAPLTPASANGSRTEVTLPGRTVSPGSQGRLPPSVHDKLESIKAWSISTYKCSRQLIAEKLGKSTRTVDSELDAKVKNLRETQSQYRAVVKTARALLSHFNDMLKSQTELGDLFHQLELRNPELRQEFQHNAEAQKALHENGTPLRDALEHFISSVDTLCEQTIEDTLTTVKHYESARLEYDAYRADLEWAGQPGGDPAVLAETRRQHDLRLAEYHRLREKVEIKIRMLDENRLKVMRSQLDLFHVAVSNYFSADGPALKTTLEHLSAASLGAGDAGTAVRPVTRPSLT